MARIGERLGRIKLVGVVKGKPNIIIGKGIGYQLKVEVLNDEGSYDTYDIFITRGSKPWRIKEGTKVGAVGILKGKTLWVDSFWRY